MYNHHLDTFIRAAELGSFSKAAGSLFISTTAIVQQINILEGRLGFTLFERSKQGIKLTAAGRSLYEDAKAIIRFSEDAVNKAKHLADVSESTVRIGTSVLFKCRLLPDLWTKVSENYPDLKIEILPMPEKQTRETAVTDLGTKYDIREGVFSNASLANKCRFLKLTETPMCCAVAKNHPLAKAKSLALKDLNGQYIVMPIKGASYELDSFREELLSVCADIKIIDSAYYGVDTFMMCEMNPYVLITQAVYADIHPNLITIPLETNYVLPYGLIYSNAPTPATRKFIEEARLVI